MQNRRDFLQLLPLSIGMLSLLSKHSAKELPQIKESLPDGPPLRIAFLGLGSYAQRVAEAIKDSSKVKITGLISGTPSKIEVWKNKYQIPEDSCYHYGNFDAIKNNPTIDAVYICTPNAQHKDQTLRLAAAGKHVICEKPMAISVAEAKEMISACEKAGVKLLIGYRMHFEAKTQEIVKMRMAGDFGKLVFFQGLCGFKIGDPNQWRLNKALAGGGAMMDIGIYAINGARYMIGEDPIWVTAQETKTDPVKFKEGVDETIQFQMGFPNGAVASCLSTYNTSHLDRFLLTGHGGFAELQPATGYGPIKGKTNKGELTQPHTTHQLMQMEEMAEMILRNKSPFLPVDGREGLKDMIIIEAIFKAVQSGNKVQISYS
jgi:predicted dehydrogenase